MGSFDERKGVVQSETTWLKLAAMVLHLWLSMEGQRQPEMQYAGCPWGWSEPCCLGLHSGSAALESYEKLLKIIWEGDGVT